VALLPCPDCSSAVYARGELLVFVDADTEVPAGVLAATLAAVGDGAVGGGARVHFEGRRHLRSLRSRHLRSPPWWTSIGRDAPWNEAPYSALSTCSGSSRVARRAGIQHATRAAAIDTPIAAR